MTAAIKVIAVKLLFFLERLASLSGWTREPKERLSIPIWL